jgi:hypothetical protein
MAGMHFARRVLCLFMCVVRMALHRALSSLISHGCHWIVAC